MRKEERGMARRRPWTPPPPHCLAARSLSLLPIHHRGWLARAVVRQGPDKRIDLLLRDLLGNFFDGKVSPFIPSGINLKYMLAF